MNSWWCWYAIALSDLWVEQNRCSAGDSVSVCVSGWVGSVVAGGCGDYSQNYPGTVALNADGHKMLQNVCGREIVCVFCVCEGEKQSVCVCLSVCVGTCE